MPPLAVAAALLALSAGVACAQTAPATDADWGLRAGLQHRRLVERDEGGRRLVKESGPMLQLAFDATLPLSAGGALQGSASVAAGGLDYRGQDQSGVPLATDSGERDLALTLAWRPLAPAQWGQAWLVLRALQQRRQIASTRAAQGLRETSMLVMPGVRVTRDFVAAGWRLQPALELRASAHHRLDVDFGGLFDDASLRGGRRWESELALAASSAGSPWRWELAWTHARQPASAQHALLRNGVSAGTVRQPRIAIDDIGVRARRAF